MLHQIIYIKIMYLREEHTMPIYLRIYLTIRAMKYIK